MKKDLIEVSRSVSKLTVKRNGNVVAEFGFWEREEAFKTAEMLCVESGLKKNAWKYDNSELMKNVKTVL